VSALLPLPDSFASTRASVHAVAEHVLAAARHAATGRIGLVSSPGGVATPPFPVAGVGERRLEVDGDRIVRLDDGARAAVGLSTLRAAADLAGIEPGGPASVYHLTTPCEPDAALVVDPAGSRALGAWFTFAAAALSALVDAVDRTLDSPSPVQLWPEHFDLATDLGPDGARANYGASPGDDVVDEPYLYVGPWQEVREDPFWDATSFTGATLRYSELRRAADAAERAVSFLRRGRELLGGAP